MKYKNQQWDIDLQKITAERLNSRFILLRIIALVAAYVPTEQINPGIVKC